MDEKHDAISKSKRILALVDDYHDKPNNDTRATLRHALFDEFERPQPVAVPTEMDRDWWDCLIVDVSAIDCRYRGDPSYDHDAYWMRDQVIEMLEKLRDTTQGKE